MSAEMQYLAPRPVALNLPSVLIVEDEPKLREKLIRQVEAFGIQPFAAGKAFEAIRIATEKRPDLVLLDGLLPEMHGLEVARYIRRINVSYTPRIAMVTGIYKNIRYQNEAFLRYGINDYLMKPVLDDTLFEVLRKTAKAKEPVPSLNQILTLVGQS